LLHQRQTTLPWEAELTEPLNHPLNPDKNCRLFVLGSGREFLELLPNAKKDVRVRRPSDLGVKALGHQNVFRRHSAAAWPEIWAAALEGL
jgi:hypothetical protein